MIAIFRIILVFVSFAFAPTAYFTSYSMIIHTNRHFLIFQITSQCICTAFLRYQTKIHKSVLHSFGAFSTFVSLFTHQSNVTQPISNSAFRHFQFYVTPIFYSPCPSRHTLKVLKIIFQSTQKLRSLTYFTSRSIHSSKERSLRCGAICQ